MVKNKNAISQSFSYIKNKTTGEITINAGAFDIKGISDVEYNLIINGYGNTVTTGDRDDIIRLTEAARSTTLSTNGGNDKVYDESSGSNIRLGAGEDYYKGTNYYDSVYGEEGDDTFVISKASQPIKGGAGNDKFILNGVINSVNVYFYGDEGDDTFDLTNVSASSNFTIVGGEGTNTVIGQVPKNVIAADIVGGNVFSLDFAANETKEILINGIKYTIQAKYNGSFMYYLNDDGSIAFNGNYFTIWGEEDKAHNVDLKGSYLAFHGGNLSDKIVANNSYCSVYGGDGDDEIILNRSALYVNGEGGNDHIVVTGSLQADSYVTGGDGDDTIDVKGTAYNLHGGSGNDVFNLLNSAALDSIIDCGEGDDTVNNQTSNTASNITLMGGAGTNTLNGKFDSVMISGFGDDVSEAKDVSFAAGETKEITINGKKYKVTNIATEGNTFQYYYNPLTEQITFGGHRFNVYAEEDVEHDIILRTNDVIFHGGRKNDKISVMQIGNDIYGLGGDDTIIVNSTSNWVSAGDGNDKIYIEGTANWATIYGGDGDDELFINASVNSSNINLESGNDTYHLNYSSSDVIMRDYDGDNTYYVNVDDMVITSGVGNDTFIINGSNNTILGQGRRHPLCGPEGRGRIRRPALALLRQ